MCSFLFLFQFHFQWLPVDHNLYIFFTCAIAYINSIIQAVFWIVAVVVSLKFVYCGWLCLSHGFCEVQTCYISCHTPGTIERRSWFVGRPQFLQFPCLDSCFRLFFCNGGFVVLSFFSQLVLFLLHVQTCFLFQELVLVFSQEFRWSAQIYCLLYSVVCFS